MNNSGLEWEIRLHSASGGIQMTNPEGSAKKNDAFEKVRLADGRMAYVL